ncbi:MAG: glycosyltransferase family 4 protein [Chloroflexi bacterium]|nr:glycosyltransferase family 4 protein [Chloroflexota bacterium]
MVRPYKRMLGLSRYTASLCQALKETDIVYSLETPTYPLPVRAGHRFLAPFNFDARTFFTTYPLAAPLRKNALKHLTVQQMATLLWLKPQLHPTVVTVHDIVPYLMRHNRDQSTFLHPLEALFDRIAMTALRKADILVAISQFTKKTLIEALSCQEDKIRVVLYGVDHNTFKPAPVSEEFRAHYGMTDEGHYILYVGSENPRKNLPRLLRAFAMLKAKVPDVKLIKVGTPQYLAQFQQLQQLVCELSLEDSVVFHNHPPEQDLVTFYNAADVFVFPSLYEGFGMPPLEALACGTPVVCSNAASLPEVVGDAAITVDPYDVEAWTEAMHRVLTNASVKEELREKGLKWAKQFTWERTARETIAVYREMYQ